MHKSVLRIVSIWNCVNMIPYGLCAAGIRYLIYSTQKKILAASAMAITQNVIVRCLVAFNSPCIAWWFYFSIWLFSYSFIFVFVRRPPIYLSITNLSNFYHIPYNAHTNLCWYNMFLVEAWCLASWLVFFMRSSSPNCTREVVIFLAMCPYAQVFHLKETMKLISSIR